MSQHRSSTGPSTTSRVPLSLASLPKLRTDGSPSPLPFSMNLVTTKIGGSDKLPSPPSHEDMMYPFWRCALVSTVVTPVSALVGCGCGTETSRVAAEQPVEVDVVPARGG